jgi:dihydropteroate synthase
MKVRLMGVLNATPDSFYGPGRTPRLSDALKRAERMISEGADWIDVGGESTRPGSNAVPLDEELRRVVPLVRQLVRRFPKLPVSVDTQKAEVARQSLEEGARMVNDVSALRSDPGMPGVLKRFKPAVVLMHMRGTPRTMQRSPRYGDPVAEVRSFLAERIRFAVASGIPRKNLWIDPGIGSTICLMFCPR